MGCRPCRLSLSGAATFGVVTDTQPPRWQEYMPLNVLLERQDPRNPKDHSDDDLGKSLGRFGYTEPVMLDERTGLLSAGHGRVLNVDIRRAKGENPPDGIVVDSEGRWLVPVNRGWASRSDDEALAYLVASNQLTIKGGWHTDPLTAILSELNRNPDGLDGVGFTPADLDLLIAETSDATWDPGTEWEGMPEFESTDRQVKHRLIIHFPTEQDRKDFIALIGTRR